MAISKKMFALRDEIIAMPEHELMLRIETFRESILVFVGNHNELKKLLEFHSETSPKALALLSVGNEEQLLAFQREITRLLHNYVASSLSLKDHARILYQELYEPDGRFPEYEEELDKRIIKSPLTSFIDCLRQYFQHYKIPVVFSEMKWSRESPVFDNKLKLNKVELERFSSWKSLAKKFLAEQGDSIDLITIVEDYHTLIMNFYQWFGGRQEDIHFEEFKKVEAKQKELATLIQNEEKLA